MSQTIKARYAQGRIEPLDPVDLEEGSELLVTIMLMGKEDPTSATAGGWKTLLDCRTFEQEVYARRRQMPRAEVRL
jgi:predicted DNA-binding antitoxin AbrB/MazE fold protein